MTAGSVGGAGAIDCDEGLQPRQLLHVHIKTTDGRELTGDGLHHHAGPRQELGDEQNEQSGTWQWMPEMVLQTVWAALHVQLAMYWHREPQEEAQLPFKQPSGQLMCGHLTSHLQPFQRILKMTRMTTTRISPTGPVATPASAFMARKGCIDCGLNSTCALGGLPDTAAASATLMVADDHPAARALTAATEDVSVIAAAQKRLRCRVNAPTHTIVGDGLPQHHVGVRQGVHNEQAPIMKATTAIAMKLDEGVTMPTSLQVNPPA